MLTAHVVYATITGNNRQVADIVTQQLSNQGCRVTETEISQTDAADLKHVDICVVCAYTYDNGALPDEGLDFYEDLQTTRLTKQVYGVAGSGDTYYGDDYNTTVDHFETAFQLTGARQGALPVKIDLAPDATDRQRLASFTTALIHTAQG
ncbi:flavodoxin [Levilactobacillus tangyuanensis]|uniref:Flavodoxin n=1 Tax=Levilactobacillus tangyuanensis TaxID=2486021 RepID=A0ABW1TKB0_9LACO|nr:flavodoxin [Levilactobacillus tangyuanensis]